MVMNRGEMCDLAALCDGVVPRSRYRGYASAGKTWLQSAAYTCRKHSSDANVDLVSTRVMQLAQNG